MVKTLLSGDVNGAFAALFKRVETVNKKNGPFDVLVCVGSFFAPGGGRRPPVIAVIWSRAPALTCLGRCRQ
jgi:hypothetical protein